MKTFLIEIFGEFDAQAKVFLLVLIAFFGLIYLRDVQEYNVNKMIFVVLSFVYCLYANVKYIAAHCMLLFPLMIGLPGNYLLPLAVIVLLAKKVDVPPKTWHFFIILLLMELLHYPLYDFSIDIAKVVGYLSTVFFVFFFMFEEDERIDRRLCLIIYCLSLSYALLIITMTFANNFGSIMEIAEEGVRAGNITKALDEEETMVLKLNPNGMGYFSLAGLLIATAMIYIKKIPLSLYVVLAVALFYGGALTVGRTWILCLALAIITFILFNKSSIGKNILFIAAIIGAAALFVINNSYIIDSFILRFEYDNLATGGERTTLIADYNDFLLNNIGYLLLGTGNVYSNNLTMAITHSVHNGIQQIAVSYGLVGLLFYCHVLYTCFKQNYIKEIMQIWPFLILFVCIQSIQLINPWNLMFPLMAVMIYMKVYRESKELDNCLI